MINKIAVIGAGAWGTGLAITAARAGKEVLIWARETEVVDAINNEHVNKVFLPDVPLPKQITATSELEEAAKADALLLVTPAQYLRVTCKSLNPLIKEGMPVVICAKGIEEKSGQLLSEIVKAELPQAVIAVLSGPTFAIEAALGKPTAITLACANEAVGKDIVLALANDTFRPYLSDDITGVEVGGAVKNVMAIAGGIVAGKKLGDNAKAALITRGLAEIMRLSEALGGKKETLMGLAGLGDLSLTANSMQSRNFSLGFAIGEGKKMQEVLEGRNSVSEGVYTASAVRETANKLGVEMPICEAVYQLLYNDANVDEIVKALLTRPYKKETE